jgi:hypothetical protein
MIDHFDRRLGLSDARIEPFKGLVDRGSPPSPALLRDVERICKEVEQERMARLFDRSLALKMASAGRWLSIDTILTLALGLIFLHLTELVVLCLTPPVLF